MSKRHALIHAVTPAPRKVCTTNWAICVLCQQVKREALQCPARSSKTLIGSGYASLVQHLLQFKAHGHTPMDLDVDCMRVMGWRPLCGTIMLVGIKLVI